MALMPSNIWLAGLHCIIRQTDTWTDGHTFCLLGLLLEPKKDWFNTFICLGCFQSMVITTLSPVLWRSRVRFSWRWESLKCLDSRRVKSVSEQPPDKSHWCTSDVILLVYECMGLKKITLWLCKGVTVSLVCVWVKAISSMSLNMKFFSFTLQ